MTRKIHILDTTLRDGEQSPGASMNTEEKLIVPSRARATSARSRTSDASPATTPWWSR